MTLRRFLHDSALYGLANLIARGIGFLLLMLYTHVLSQSEIGAFEWLTAASFPLLALLPLEITQALARLRTQELSEKELQSSVRSAFSFTILMLGGFAVLVLVLMGILGYSLPMTDMPKSLPMAAAILLVVNGCFAFAQNELRWSKRAGDYALTSVITAVVTAGCVVVLLTVLHIGIMGLYIAMILGSLSGLCVAIGKVPYLLRPRLYWSELAPLLRFSYPLAISCVLIILATTIDRLLLAHFLDLAALGLYGIAARFASMAMLALHGFQMAVLPSTMGREDIENREKELERSLRIFLLIAVGMALILSAISPWILRLLFAEPYWNAEVYIPMILIGTVTGATCSFAPGLWLTGKSYQMVFLGGVLVMVGFAAGWWLIPQAGVMGAALSYAITGIVYGLLAFWLSERVFPVHHRHGRLAWTIVLFILASTVLTGMAVQSWDVVWRILFVLLTMFPVIFLLTHKQERTEFRQWLRRRD